MALGLELLSSLFLVYDGAVMGQVPSFAQGQIYLYGSSRSRCLRSPSWPWASAFMHSVRQCLGMALPWLHRGTKSPLEKPSATITLCNTRGWLLLQGNRHLLGVTRVLLPTPPSTSPLHPGLPGAFGVRGSHVPALLSMCWG